MRYRIVEYSNHSCKIQKTRLGILWTDHCILYATAYHVAYFDSFLDAKHEVDKLRKGTKKKKEIINRIVEI